MRNKLLILSLAIMTLLMPLSVGASQAIVKDGLVCKLYEAEFSQERAKACVWLTSANGYFRGYSSIDREVDGTVMTTQVGVWDVDPSAPNPYNLVLGVPESSTYWHVDAKTPSWQRGTDDCEARAHVNFYFHDGTKVDDTIRSEVSSSYCAPGGGL